MSTTTIWVALAVVQSAEMVWLIILTAAWVAQRRRQDRLLARVGVLSKSLTKIGRMRHTGSQPVVTSTQLTNRPPPFPVAPPTTNPMHPPPSRGRHASS